MPSRPGGLVGRALGKIEEVAGQSVVPTERLELLEQAYVDLRATQREQELLGWHVLDYFSGQPQELRADTRKKWAQKARYAYINDPMAGAAVDLLNDFVFGRGVPKPTAKDEEAQNVIDEAWDDPDNQLVLTSYAAQIALGTDLSLQANLFLLMFEGEDGKIKLGLLNHDDVFDAVRDPDNRLRVLYYVAKQRRIEWDFNTDTAKLDLLSDPNRAKTVYYEHWQNVQQAKDEGREVPTPPADKLAKGRVYHISVNKGMEQVFGVPTMQRTLRWFGAYNDFMKSRVDMTKAAAAIVMKRKIKGTDTQLQRMAQRAVTRQSDLGLAQNLQDETNVAVPPLRGGIWNENEGLTLEPFKVDSGAGNAVQDGSMLRAQVSAATRFPQHYLGDNGNANLATATAMELPVLKAVESRQEVFEGSVRWFVDRVIEHAVDTGRLDPNVTTEKPTEDMVEEPGLALVQHALREATYLPEALRVAENVQVTRVPWYNREKAALEHRWTAVVEDTEGARHFVLVEAHEDKVADEVQTDRDLSYEFSMPNPLRRVMSDLIGSIAQIAQVFDPNNSNTELSRVLLTIALGEGLEVQDPSEMVERIFPENYVDPAIAAAQAAAGMGLSGDGGGGGFSQVPGGPPDQSAGAQALGGDTSLGAKGGAVPAEKQPLVASALRETVLSGRLGQPLVVRVSEGGRYQELPETTRVGVEARKSEIDKLFEDDVLAVASDELTRLHVGNGNGKNGGS